MRLYSDGQPFNIFFKVTAGGGQREKKKPRNVAELFLLRMIADQTAIGA
jgi:hypothetical protein